MNEGDSQVVQVYNDRIFTERSICNWVPPDDIPGSKFYRDGRIKPFYGMTCIAWIERTSALFEDLCALQATIRRAFEQQELGSLYTFLDPASFHMTVCDIDADSDPSLIQVEKRITEARKAFTRIGTPGKVTSLIRGIGLQRTITAMVRFDDGPEELRKVQAMEHEIKQATGRNVKAFLGHISLAYIVKKPSPGEMEKIKAMLCPYRDRVFVVNDNYNYPLMTIRNAH